MKPATFAGKLRTVTGLLKDSKFNRLALMEKWPNFENLPQGTEKPVTFLIFEHASQFTLVAQSLER